jgi:hypothetical protein
MQPITGSMAFMALFALTMDTATATSSVASNRADRPIGGLSSQAPHEVTVRRGRGWKIVRIGSEYRAVVVTDEPAPVRSAYPRLLIDGIRYRAWLSDDRLTWSTAIAADMVDGIRDIQIAKNQKRAQKATGPQNQVRALADIRLAPPAPVIALSSRPVPEKVPDPSAPGPFKVTRADYDLGDEVLDIEGSDIKSELRAALYLPVDAPGPLPVVVFQHGVHAGCHDGENAEISWPCKSGYQAIPNHEGYDAPAEALASHGYAVVSLSANGINAATSHWRPETVPAESIVRGQLILDHLDLLAEANAGNVPELASLHGRLDLGRIGLMGHSRGGEGAARAVLMNATRERPYGIEAVLPLASTSEPYGIPDVPLVAILPFCDGDVGSLEGQGYVEKSRHAFPDSVLRGSLLIMGANHNFFNTVWSPGPYPGGADDAKGLGGACESAVRLTATAQHALGAVYIAGFFRMTVGNEHQFLPLFDGSNVEVPGLPGADARSVATFPASARYDVQTFDLGRAPWLSGQKPAWQWGVQGKGRGEICTDDCGGNRPVFFLDSLLLLDRLAENEPTTLTLQPTDAPGALAPVNAANYRFLSFRLGRAQDPADRTPPSLRLSAHLGKSQVHVDPRSNALQTFPTLTYEKESLETMFLQQVHIPIASFDPKETASVDRIALTMTGGGRVLASDLAFVTPATGKGRPSHLPAVSVDDVEIEHSSSDRNAPVRVSLSRAATTDISLRLFVPRAGSANVTFAPGEREKTVEIQIPGSWPSGDCWVVATELKNAFASRTKARLRIRGDDTHPSVCGMPEE